MRKSVIVIAALLGVGCLAYAFYMVAFHHRQGESCYFDPYCYQ